MQVGSKQSVTENETYDLIREKIRFSLDLTYCKIPNEGRFALGSFRTEIHTEMWFFMLSVRIATVACAVVRIEADPNARRAKYLYGDGGVV